MRMLPLPSSFSCWSSSSASTARDSSPARTTLLLVLGVAVAVVCQAPATVLGAGFLVHQNLHPATTSSRTVGSGTRNRRSSSHPVRFWRSDLLVGRSGDADSGLPVGATKGSSPSSEAPRLVDSAAAPALSSIINDSVEDEKEPPSQGRVWDRELLVQYAASQGVELSLTTLGPAFRGIARSTTNRTQILSYVEGIIRLPPQTNVLHLDKMEVFRPVVQRVRKDNPNFCGGGNPLGVGLLVAYLCVLHGTEQGCTTAEFLAINDADLQHKRLVKLYRLAGFDYVKYVGDGWKDVPDRLVWGGCGTLLRKDIPTLLQFWSGLLDKGRRKTQDQTQLTQ